MCFLLPVCGVPRGGSFIIHETVIRFCQIARLCPADSFMHGFVVARYDETVREGR